MAMRNFYTLGITWNIHMPFLENIATDVFGKPTAAHPFNYWPMGWGVGGFQRKQR